MKDITYLNFLQNKKQLQLQYKELYNKVAYSFRGQLYKSNQLKNLFMKDIFDSTNSKTFTEFMEALGANTELYNEYEKVISAVANIFDNVEATLIVDICLITYTFDTYVGFMVEYLIFSCSNSNKRKHL